MLSNRDEYYMKEALRQARKAAALEEVPIGCVIVQGDHIIARGYNRRNTDKNVLSHAELNAMKKAVRRTGDWRLEDCTMYITLEPCQMCAGAIVQARIPRVVIGAMNSKAGCAGSVINLLQMKQFNHQVEITKGVLEAECSEVLSEFFRELRTRNGSSGSKILPAGEEKAACPAAELHKENTTGHGRRRKEKRMGPFKVLLWDIDGTLLNFLAAEKEALRFCFHKHGLGECTDEMIERYSVINRRYWEALERGEVTKQQVLVGRYQEFLTAEGLDASKSEVLNDDYQLALGDYCIFCDDGYEILKLFQGKVGQYAVTNGTNVAQTKKLRVSGMDQIFDGVFISDRIGHEKPTVEYFEAVFAGLKADMEAGKLPADLKKEEILIIGDSLTSDIRGGNNAGIPTCWYNPRHQINDKGVHVDFEITNLHQVIPISGVRKKSD